MPRIIIHSFDYDKCTDALFDSEANLLFNREEFKKAFACHFSSLSGQTTAQQEVYIGSKRQSEEMDKHFAERAKNGECLVNLKKLSDDHSWKYRDFLFSTVDVEYENRWKKKAETKEDQTKVNLIQQQLLDAARHHPGEEVDFYFYDDDSNNEIFEALEKELIVPPGFKVHLLKASWQNNIFKESVILNATPLKEKEEKKDIFGNNPKAAYFESELAFEILKAAPNNSLIKVNQAINDYITRHLDYLKTSAAIFNQQLLQYKLISGFTSDPIDTFLKLLHRPLDGPEGPKNISECFTLHLIFFNYHHLFEPQRDVVVEQRQEIESERKSLHDKIRHGTAKIFEEKIRGRQRIENSTHSKAFGITDDKDIPKEWQEWHRYEYTPHKFRARMSETSPLIQTFRKNGIPSIAGPSGTAADCLEGIHFLLPQLPLLERIEYLNLLAAAEVAQGHHSYCEIIIVACALNMLPEVLCPVLTESLWENIDYHHAYQRFLSYGFKKTGNYKKLMEKYPEYLVKDKLIDVNDPKEMKELIKLQRLVKRGVAEDFLIKGDFWQRDALLSDKDQKFHKKTNFLKLKSRENLKKIQTEVGSLSTEEQLFLKLFMSFDFELSHYTKHLDKILSTKQMLSATQVKKLIKDFEVNSTEKDQKFLGNEDYIFFRFELEHQIKSREIQAGVFSSLDNKPVESRFGDQCILLNGRKSGLLETGWISFFDMLAPYAASIVKNLTHQDKSVREFDKTYDYKDGNIQFNYLELKKVEKFDIGGTVFYGPDIMQGIALLMIRELRRVGGEMQKEFLEKLKHLNSTLPIKEGDYIKFKEYVNPILSQLFRVEAKIPGRIDLEYQEYFCIDKNQLRRLIQADNVEHIKKVLPFSEFQIMKPELNGCSPVKFAVESGSVKVLQWFVNCGVDEKEILAALQKLVPIYVKNNNLSSLKKLIESYFEININEKDYDGNTPLLVAARKGNIAMIDCLSTHKDVDMKAVNGEGLNYIQNLELACLDLVKNSILKYFTDLYQHFPALKVIFQEKQDNHFVLQELRKKCVSDSMISTVRMDEYKIVYQDIFNTEKGCNRFVAMQYIHFIFLGFDKLAEQWQSLHSSVSLSKEVDEEMLSIILTDTISDIDISQLRKCFSFNDQVSKIFQRNENKFLNIAAKAGNYRLVHELIKDDKEKSEDKNFLETLFEVVRGFYFKRQINQCIECFTLFPELIRTHGRKIIDIIIISRQSEKFEKEFLLWFLSNHGKEIYPLEDKDEERAKAIDCCLVRCARLKDVQAIAALHDIYPAHNLICINSYLESFCYEKSFESNGLEWLKYFKNLYPSLNLNAHFLEAQTLLMLAAQRGNLDMMEWLLKEGANPSENIEDKDYLDYLIINTKGLIGDKNFSKLQEVLEKFPQIIKKSGFNLIGQQVDIELLKATSEERETHKQLLESLSRHISKELDGGVSSTSRMLIAQGLFKAGKNAYEEEKPKNNDGCVIS